jgi:CheY-like chemotaxis protein
LGSTFWFELNLAAAPHPTGNPPVSTTMPQSQEKSGTRTRTLLYVEDNPATLKLVEQILADRPDIRLLTAVDGDLGIELAREYHPDVILMDINLPGISGIQALGILHEDPATAHIPVLALSANAMPLDIKNGIEAGFFRYLTKPINNGELMAALDLALKLGEKSVTKE